MLRCVTLALLLALLVPAAQAQAVRRFPATALRGEVVVKAPPEVLLNGQPARLAPGARIKGPNNLLLMSGALINQRLIVHYTLDSYGNVLDVWILTADELARRPWPVTPQQAAAWSFNPDAQVWTRP